MPNVFPLTSHATVAGAFPCLLLNPSQDYWHLKDRRADIQACGYNGLRAPSTRVTVPGNMIVLFDDQSGNLLRITPYEAEFRLVTPAGAPFVSHVLDTLDYHAGEIRILPPAHGAPPSALATFAAWTRIAFNH